MELAVTTRPTGRPAPETVRWAVPGLGLGFSALTIDLRDRSRPPLDKDRRGDHFQRRKGDRAVGRTHVPQITHSSKRTRGMPGKLEE